MAVLGKIRSKGALLVGIIGLGLFAFIAEEAVRSCESSKNNERQQIAKVLGEKISYQEFQALVDEYTDVMKMTQNKENLTETELNQVRDYVWNNYIQTALISKEAKELGLTVTDDEMRNVLTLGTNPMLMQTPFVNQQTGRFDANALKQFLNEYKKAQASNPQQAEQYRTIYNYWTFIEKTLRQQLLAQKYQTLFASCFLSNQVEAKQAFEEENTEADVQVAVFPYNSIADKDVKINDADLKAKYDEMKPRFRQYEETRDIKYVAYQVKASATDRAALNKQMKAYAADLAAAADPSEVVRKANSQVAYLGVPVLKSAFPTDIAQQIDSMAVGATTGIKENAADNTLNIVKLVSKQELPDSIEYQTIALGGETTAEANNRADSVMNALNADATQWDALAKKYGQTGAKQWMTAQQYQFATSMSAENKDFLNALNTMAAGETRNISTASGNIIVKVTDRKNFQTKYVAAVIKTNIAFSDNTQSKAYNKFSQYVSENQTLEGLEKNAKKYGYNVLEIQDVRSAQHLIANIPGTHEALKWVYEAKENEVSPLYECGNNDAFLVLVVTKIHEKGYRSLDDTMVKEMVKAEVMKDKKAEMIMAKTNGVKNVSTAKAKGAQVTEIPQITFASPAFVSIAGTAEPALSGAVAATKAGQFSRQAVKGNGGVYFFQVISKKNRGQKFDEKSYEQRMAQRAMQAAGNFMQELYINADITDNRYLFF